MFSVLYLSSVKNKTNVKAFFKTCKYKGTVKILNTGWKADIYMAKCRPVVISSITIWQLIPSQEGGAEEGWTGSKKWGISLISFAILYLSFENP